MNIIGLCITFDTTISLGLTPLILSNFWTKVVSLRLNKRFSAVRFQEQEHHFVF
jgi:hypothetical protein